ncbi:MAG TPA: potassium transporter TrkG, partial [Candidatus Hydrogenedentes bacterium]|nr:potassium transporter TrkG [Candidatus Hydrogenedentota bacterium]
MTTTGFCTVDFNTWPYFARMLLVVLMFVGGCAGSTGGGIKVVRFVILLKMAYARLKQTFRPKMVRAVRVSGHVVD